MDNKKISDFVDSYGNDIYGFCIYLTRGTLIDSDDLYQETFLKAMEKSHLIDKDKNVKSYLFAVAVKIFQNERRKYIRKNASLISMDEETALYVKSDEDTEETYLRNEDYARLNSAVSELSDIYRIPILLFYTAELSVKDIAKILKCPQGTVKRRLFTAKKLLRSLLEQ